MLPANFYNGPDHGQYGDSKFLIEWIDKLPIRMQKPVSEKYSEIYTQLVKDDPNECRARVNTWLRKTVEKNKPVDDGLLF
jgi:hypothetical protein